MLKKTIVYIGLIVCGLPLMAQMYSGVNTLKLSSAGTNTSTELKSNQLVSRLVFDEQKLSMMVKTGAIHQLANEEDKKLLEEVFMIESNPLMSIVIDLSSLGLKGAESFSKEAAQLPYQLSFNDKMVEGTANINLDYSTDKSLIKFEIETTISTREMGIHLGSAYTSRFSDNMLISVKGAEMTRRY